MAGASPAQLQVQQNGQRSGRPTIRGWLFVSFLLVALIPIVAIGAGTLSIGYYNGSQQAISRLESVAARKALEADVWVQTLQDELLASISEKYAVERAAIVLDLAQGNAYYDVYNRAVRRRFQTVVEQSAYLQEVFLVSMEGAVVLSTDTANETISVAGEPYFRQGLAGACVQMPAFSQSDGAVGAIVARPVVGDDGQVFGVIAGRAGTQPLAAILSEATGLGDSGRAYLVDGTRRLWDVGRLVSATRALEPGHVDSAGVRAALGGTSGAGVYAGYDGIRVVGAYRWSPALQAALLVEQRFSEAFSASVTSLSLTLGVALLAILLAFSISLLITRSIAGPLEQLARTATHVAAGDLDRAAPVGQIGEIGALAQAFNSMTAQLRDLIAGLESRVRDRTHDLEIANQTLQRRALQLETSAAVSRGATSILDIGALSNRVAELINDAFGYSGVTIFLLDKEAGQLVIQAAAGDRSPQHQRLELNMRSLNGEVAQTNVPLVINDVSQDPRYLADVNFPETRSELVIPLRVGSSVIGTLDIQSAEVGTFNYDDVIVFQSLGDQIAIAIQNARLYEQSRELAIMEERNRLARELHDSVTQSLYSLTLLAEGWRRSSAGGEARTDERLKRVREIAGQALREMRLLIYELRPSDVTQVGLVGALRQRLDAVEHRAGMDAQLVATDVLDLPPLIETGLYRIAQEALNNALKYAEATSVTVRLQQRDSEVWLEVTDNGRGFDPEAAEKSGGMGLVNMRERARGLGGSLQVVSTPEAGSTVRVILPAAPLEARRKEAV
jgi:signal transduction histidine kinase